MKKIITSLPIKPQSNPKTGLFLTPVFLETIAKLEGGESVLFLNLLHSFKDYSIHKQKYIQALNEANITFDDISFDVDQLDKYKQIINDMYAQGLLKKAKREVNKCDCGRVEINDDLIAHIMNKKMIKQDDNVATCSTCNSSLKKQEVTCLELVCENVFDYKLDVFPQMLEKRIVTGLKDFHNTTLNVSKIRNTGVSVCLDGDKFNIDIDFLLYLTPQLFEGDEITLICCHRHMRHFLLTNYINAVFGHKQLKFVAHPYIVSKNGQDSYESLTHQPDKDLIKASLLNSSSWTSLDTMWDEGKYLYLKKNRRLLDKVMQVDGDDGQNIDEKLVKYCSVIERIRDLKRKQNEESQIAPEK